MRNEYKYFGVWFNEDKTPKYMTKDNFVNYNHEKNKYLTEYAKNKALENYDINIKYFESLGKEEFENAVNDCLNTYAFAEIFDLNDIKGKQGIYILVLDNYKQLYIGQTSRDLKERIMSHFKIEIPFQKVPFIEYDTLPIDAFKPMDTTRIFAIFTSEEELIDNIESKLISKCPNKFILNKTIGGKANSYVELFIRLGLGRIKKDM